MSASSGNPAVADAPAGLLGPVLGSLVVTTIATNTLDSHANWQFQFYVCGAAGLVVAVIALFGLRELSPRVLPAPFGPWTIVRLRDQLMVVRCDIAVAGTPAENPSWAPDSRGLAWSEPDGIHVTPSACEAAPRLVVPGGQHPDWGPFTSSGDSGSAPSSGSAMRLDAPSSVPRTAREARRHADDSAARPLNKVLRTTDWNRGRS